MQPKPPAQIRRIAQQVRNWAEDVNAQYGDWDHDLCGACAVASYELWYRLRKSGFKDTELIYGDGHAFVRWRNWIVDVTASQFGLSKVMVRHRNSRLFRNKHNFWTIVNGVARSVREVKKVFAEWPPEQHPLEYWSYVRKSK